MQIAGKKRIGNRILTGAAAAVAGVMFFAPSPARAVISVNVVNDTWADGERLQPGLTTYSEYGTDSDSDGNIESTWFVNNNGGSNATTVGHMSTSPSTASMNWYTYFTPSAATPIVLNNTGDSVKVTWVFTPTGVNAGNTSQQFNMGVGTASVRPTTDGGSPPAAAYTGYSLFTNMGNPNLGNSNPFQLRKRSNLAAGANFLNSSGDWATILGNGATSGNHGYDSATPYTLEWTMTRNAANGLDIDAKMSGGTLDGDGVAEVITTDAAPNSFSFDMFGVRPSGSAGSATTFDTTLFKVEGPIPEPASVSLLLGAGAATMLRRRRRQNAQ